MSGPKGSVLNRGLNSKANVDAVVAARTALGNNISSEDPVVRLLLQHLVSPIEAVIFKPANNQIQAANVLVTARLDLKTIEEVNALFKHEAEQKGMLSLGRPITNEQPGTLLADKLTLLMRFDAANQRLFIVGGIMPDAALLDKAATLPKQAPLMQTEEQKIDASGQGLFAWVNTEQLMPMMPPGLMAQAQAYGIDKVRRLAIGMGMAEGKGRLSLLLNAPGLSLASMGMSNNTDATPRPTNDLSLKASGSPSTVAVLQLPDRALVDMAINMMKMTMNGKQVEEFDKDRVEFSQKLGFDPTEIFEVFGQELVVFSDDLSEYLALAVRDEAKLDALLKKIKANGVTVEERNKYGVTITHAALPTTWNKALLEFGKDTGKGNPQLLKMLSRIHEHYYWVREGRYLVLSAVPQDLMDRARHPEHMAIGEWLKDTQKQPGEDAVLQVSTRFENIPRKFYYTYLQLLSLVAEASGSNFDIFSMPTAQELQLPDDGAYGLRLTAGDSQYMMEITYENNPVEFFANQSMTTVAAAGILAAVAIPAYHDYVGRAQVAESMSAAAQARIWVAEQYSMNQRFPNADEISQVISSLQSQSPHVTEIKVEADSGVIVIKFSSQSELDGGNLSLTPEIDSSGNIKWSCTSDFPKKHLPASCR
jgi:Tfp pilus assembly major pilin PilA